MYIFKSNNTKTIRILYKNRKKALAKFCNGKSKMAINIHGLMPYKDFNSNINTIEVHGVDELEIVAKTSIGLHVGFAENATK